MKKKKNSENKEDNKENNKESNKESENTAEVEPEVVNNIVELTPLLEAKTGAEESEKKSKYSKKKQQKVNLFKILDKIPLLIVNLFFMRLGVSELSKKEEETLIDAFEDFLYIFPVPWLEKLAKLTPVAYLAYVVYIIVSKRQIELKEMQEAKKDKDKDLEEEFRNEV